MDFDWFWLILIDFDWFWWILMYFDGFWLILMDFDWFWWILMNFDGFWWILMDFDGFWLILIDFDWFWLILMDFDRFWLILMDFGVRKGQVQGPAPQGSATTITVTYFYVERINSKLLQLQLQSVILRNYKCNPLRRHGSSQSDYRSTSDNARQAMVTTWQCLLWAAATAFVGASAWQCLGVWIPGPK